MRGSLSGVSGKPIFLRSELSLGF